MNMATKKNVFHEYLQEWLVARDNRNKRAKIPRQICFVTKIHPKSIPRSFKRVHMYNSGLGERRGRPEYCTPGVTVALKELWDIAGERCGENPRPMIPDHVIAFKRDSVWKYGDEVKGKLFAMGEEGCETYWVKTSQ